MDNQKVFYADNKTIYKHQSTFFVLFAIMVTAILLRLGVTVYLGGGTPPKKSMKHPYSLLALATLLRQSFLPWAMVLF